MSGTTGEDRGSWLGATILLALPGLLAVIAPVIGSALPENSIEAQGLAAVLCMAPAWCCAAWLPWAIVGGWRTGWWGPAVACA
ncbi:MAG: hypothetical protein VX265_13400, partial [Myxococcota bacterium]|nr:hypothetical protein [Myxococcota bacterium]